MTTTYAPTDAERVTAAYLCAMYPDASVEIVAPTGYAGMPSTLPTIRVREDRAGTDLVPLADFAKRNYQRDWQPVPGFSRASVEVVSYTSTDAPLGEPRQVSGRHGAQLRAPMAWDSAQGTILRRDIRPRGEAVILGNVRASSSTFVLHQFAPAVPVCDFSLDALERAMNGLRGLVDHADSQAPRWAVGRASADASAPGEDGTVVVRATLTLEQSAEGKAPSLAYADGDLSGWPGLYFPSVGRIRSATLNIATHVVTVEAVHRDA